MNNPIEFTNIPAWKFHKLNKKLSNHFEDNGYIRAYKSNIVSILAACEDPRTIIKFLYGLLKFPKRQTNQMHLENALLAGEHKPCNAVGLYEETTSWRWEENLSDRYRRVFPMCEFEREVFDGRDCYKDLLDEITALVTYLGFDTPVIYRYEDVATGIGGIVTHDDEKRLCPTKSSCAIITHFPQHSSPFWNMARTPDGKYALKADVILNGMETIGAAVRSCDPEQMMSDFLSVSEGQYVATLYKHFGKPRVDAEMEAFLSQEFIPRYGGGIGFERLLWAMEANGQI